MMRGNLVGSGAAESHRFWDLGRISASFFIRRPRRKKNHFKDPTERGRERKTMPAAKNEKAPLAAFQRELAGVHGIRGVAWKASPANGP